MTARKGIQSKVRRQWPVTLWFVGCEGTEWEARREDVIGLIASGLFPELEKEFPELANAKFNSSSNEH
jgi:hypothetical protein